MNECLGNLLWIRIHCFIFFFEIKKLHIKQELKLISIIITISIIYYKLNSFSITIKCFYFYNPQILFLLKY